MLHGAVRFIAARGAVCLMHVPTACAAAISDASQWTSPSSWTPRSLYRWKKRRAFQMVEMGGLEPPTPYMRRRTKKKK